MIELGVGMFGDVQINRKTGKIQDAGQRMQEILEEVKLMDQVGLDFFGIGEHHRKDYAVAAPEILLAAAASETKNITLGSAVRSEEHTSELQSRGHLVCRLLLEKKKKIIKRGVIIN